MIRRLAARQSICVEHGWAAPSAGLRAPLIGPALPHTSVHSLGYDRPQPVTVTCMVAMPSLIIANDRPRWLVMLIACAAAGAIVGGLAMVQDPASPWRWLHWFGKPLTTGLILLLVWRTPLPVSPRYRRWIATGIGFSLVGDVLLMLPGDLFVPGLAAFLLGHLCFIAAFVGDSRFAGRPLLLLVSLGYGLINLWLLWGSIGAPLRLPVIVYVIVLTSMGGRAMVRARSFSMNADPRAGGARLAAIGALTFMLSDSLLAWNRFHAAIPWATLWVLSTYYLALWWIACSVQVRRSRRAQ
jgi:uncharacterized membrane protein YhhN